jgi:hypothetical protein
MCKAPCLDGVPEVEPYDPVHAAPGTRSDFVARYTGTCIVAPFLA